MIVAIAAVAVVLVNKANCTTTQRRSTTIYNGNGNDDDYDNDTTTQRTKVIREEVTSFNWDEPTTAWFVVVVAESIAGLLRVLPTRMKRRLCSGVLQIRTRNIERC